jgi:ferredoxin--NADP+ reductase
MQQRIANHTEISPDVFLLSVERRFDFQPGQTVKVGLSGIAEPRIYSICSGNRDPELSILYNIKDDGELTPRLAKLKPGDEVEISEPGGGFIGTSDPSVWIATGTGVAPFYSMLRSGMGKGQILLHGVRRADQFYFSNDWKNTLGENYHRFCSGEVVNGIPHGRVNQWLETAELSNDRNWYLCGQASMCVEVRDLLIARGIPFGKILTEIYF